jgi:DNA mismatch repair protein MutS2
MLPSALRALEFDRIVWVVSGLSVTPTGRDRLAELQPLVDARAVAAAQRATTEGTRFLADHPGFPLRAPEDLHDILEALDIDGRALEPLRLTALADYLESIEQSRSAVANAAARASSAVEGFPILRALVAAVVSFKGEIAEVRRTIDPSGAVADNASPALASIRDRLRRQRARLRTTLESFLRGRETAKYLQEQVVTDRNGRYVLVVKAEHLRAIPGIVHGSSASGASLFLEPLGTVEINNDIVALEEQEAEEVRRILLQLTDAFRRRPDDLSRTVEVATELDVIQARARFSEMVEGVEPVLATDGALELRGARHPLLIRRVAERLGIGARGPGIGNQNPEPATGSPARPVPHPRSPIPVDILLSPPARVLLITGPNTGGKTVALKTAGLLAAMAQAGLHVPVEKGSRLPVFRSLFADIGDEQSIAASLSTFSAHISNLVSMDRHLELPALVLLDEVGAGTDPVEGGALGIAVIDHLRRRGSHLVATTHYDSLKSYASTTEGVVGAAFGFNPETFAPTYRLVYGSPGRSLAIEIAARLGMPASVIAAARENLSEREQQLADHLARIDHDLRTLEQERRLVARERATVSETEKQLRSREETVHDREERFRKKLDARLDDQVRDARREIDLVIEGLKARAAELSEEAARRASAKISTGDAGAARAEARSAIEEVVSRLKQATDSRPAPPPPFVPPRGTQTLSPGVTVAVGTLGLEGIVIEVHGKHAEVDVRGKRLRASLRDLRVIEEAGSATRNPAFDRRAGTAGSGPTVHVSVNLQPREGSLSELNVIGCTVDEAVARTEKFLDESTVTDLRVLRLIHGHGTGQLRRALTEFLKGHPLVARAEAAPPEQGGGGVTIVELKE